MGFQDAVMSGLARDGGLLLPESFPKISPETLTAWQALSYTDLAFEIMNLYTDLPEDVLRDIITRSYQAFDCESVTPLVSVGDYDVLELFHGPTLAFKDIALQFLGNVFEYILETRDSQLNILAATSGDTGSAAIYGVRGKPRINIFVTYPDGRISASQEHQMTSVLDDNVHNIAVTGTFDDCQMMMKTIFSDLAFKDAHSLGAVNSVNWARVLAQIVYFFYGAFRCMEKHDVTQVQFSVPTGNFGDIFAGYIALQMGAPIKRLILATNENDILARYFNTGVYKKGDVHASISPAMDIQVASNFERYLYYQCGEDGEMLSDLIARFESTGQLECPSKRSDNRIVAGHADTVAILDMIKTCWQKERYLLDPHTAVGVYVAKTFMDNVPTICLATAHPAKFSEVMTRALGEDIASHPILERLKGLPVRHETMPVDLNMIKQFISKHT